MRYGIVNLDDDISKMDNTKQKGTEDDNDGFVVVSKDLPSDTDSDIEIIDVESELHEFSPQIDKPAQYRPKVFFEGILDSYPVDSPVVAKLSPVDGFQISRGDRVCMLPAGWLSLKEAVAFGEIRNGFVRFDVKNLPKKSNELYHLCYSTDQTIPGVSDAFSFREVDESHLVSQMGPSGSRVSNLLNSIWSSLPEAGELTNSKTNEEHSGNDLVVSTTQGNVVEDTIPSGRAEENRDINEDNCAEENLNTNEDSTSAFRAEENQDTNEDSTSSSRVEEAQDTYEDSTSIRAGENLNTNEDISAEGNLNTNENMTSSCRAEDILGTNEDFTSCPNGEMISELAEMTLQIEKQQLHDDVPREESFKSIDWEALCEQNYSKKVEPFHFGQYVEPVPYKWKQALMNMRAKNDVTEELQKRTRECEHFQTQVGKLQTELVATQHFVEYMIAQKDERFRSLSNEERVAHKYVYDTMKSRYERGRGCQFESSSGAVYNSRSRMNAVHEEKMRELKRQHEKEISTLVESYEGKLNDLKDVHEKEIENMKLGYTEELKAYKLAYDSRSEDIAAQLVFSKYQRDNLEKEFEKMKEAHQLQLKLCAKEYTKLKIAMKTEQNAGTNAPTTSYLTELKARVRSIKRKSKKEDSK